MDPVLAIGTPGNATLLGDRDRRALDAAMDRCADGDDAAFALVYDLLAPGLLALFQRRLGGFAQAEAVVEQTLLQLYAGRRNYATGSDVLAWALAIGDAVRHASATNIAVRECTPIWR
jgi:hypothetical protein